jgi:hypothetical protein
MAMGLFLVAYGCWKINAENKVYFLWSKKAVAYKVIFGYPYFWWSRKVIENKEFLLLAAKNPPNKILKTYYFYYFQQVFSGRQIK